MAPNVGQFRNWLRFQSYTFHQFVFGTFTDLMSSIPFGNLLESLPNEILFEILGYLDVSSFFSVHCTSKFLFDTLYDLNCSKANNCCRKANFRLVKVLDTNRSLEHSENFRKYVFYNECYDLVRGTPHDFIVLNVAQLAKCDIQRLITKYKSLFRYNLLQICPISLDVSSIIVTYRFLTLFYLRENVTSNTFCMSLEIWVSKQMYTLGVYMKSDI